MWIGVGDIVLIGLRDFQDDKADIIMKYTPDEARQLKAYGEIPENGNKSGEALYVETIDNNETNDGGDEDACVFQFEIDSIYFCLFKLAWVELPVVIDWSFNSGIVCCTNNAWVDRIAQKSKDC